MGIPIKKTIPQGFIYVVRVGDNYKIGKTINMRNRLGEYTRLYEEPKVLICEKVYNYSTVEVELHKKYKDKQLRGEWFSLTASDIKNIKAFLKKKATEIPTDTKVKANNAPFVDFDNCTFVKVKLNNAISSFPNETELVKALKDDLKTFYALTVMKHFLLKDRNILVKNIVKDGKEQTVKFTAIDLQEALGYKTRQAASKHIMKLKSLNIVKGIKTKDFGYVFAINPNYYMNGTSVPKEISELFNEGN